MKEVPSQPSASAHTAVLHGRVTNEAGAPLAGVRVRAAIPATDMRFVDAGAERGFVQGYRDHRLHKLLETYRVPTRLVGRPSRDGTIPPRLYPIFRDREELPVSADLSSNINTALARSIISSTRRASISSSSRRARTTTRCSRNTRRRSTISSGISARCGACLN